LRHIHIHFHGKSLQPILLLLETLKTLASLCPKADTRALFSLSLKATHKAKTKFNFLLLLFFLLSVFPIGPRASPLESSPLSLWPLTSSRARLWQIDVMMMMTVVVVAAGAGSGSGGAGGVQIVAMTKRHLSSAKGRQQQTSNCQIPTSKRQLQTANCKLQTAHCPLL